MKNRRTDIIGAALGVMFLMAGASQALAAGPVKQVVRPKCHFKAPGDCVVRIKAPRKGPHARPRVMVVRPRGSGGPGNIRRLEVRVLHGPGSLRPAKLAVRPFRPVPRLVVKHIGQPARPRPACPTPCLSQQPCPNPPVHAWVRPPRPIRPIRPFRPIRPHRPFRPHRPHPWAPGHWRPVPRPTGPDNAGNNLTLPPYGALPAPMPAPGNGNGGQPLIPDHMEPNHNLPEISQDNTLQKGTPQLNQQYDLGGDQPLEPGDPAFNQILGL
jgi:hypothetical protein